MGIILASQSPRRKELLELMGLDFQIITSDIEENTPKDASPEDVVCSLAYQKAEAVARKYPNDCVIGADTIVYLDGDILGKPHTAERAKTFLRRMQGRQHTVYTGVAVLTNGSKDVRYETTRVTFAPMSEQEIEWYVSTGDPLDKAGAYGVQGPFGVFVTHLDGNYFNVIGMPLPLLYQMLLKAGVIKEDRRT